MLQFNRRCRLKLEPAVNSIVGGKTLIIEGLRVTFEVRKSMVSKTGYNRTTVSVTNLSEKHRQGIDAWGVFQNGTTALAKAYLEVGYGDQVRLLSKADLFRYRHSFEPPDVVTHFESDDGRVLGDTMVSVPSPSGNPFAPLEDLCKDVGGQIGSAIKAPFTEYPDLAKKMFTTGYSFFGKANDALTDLSKEGGADFHFVDDEPTIIPWDPDWRLLVPSGTMPYISETTGLIGIPERIDDVMTRSGRQSRKNRNLPATNPGWEIRTLLNDRIVPGGWVKLVSKRQNINGYFLVESVTHSGDTHGEDWTSKARLAISHA